MQLGTHITKLQKKRSFRFGRLIAFVCALSLILSHPSFVFNTIGDILIPSAHAEGGGGGCGGSCGGGEEGGGGGEGGSKAAEILMGIAAIVAPIAAAMAQVAAAKEKADADKFIAKTSADAAIKQTSIQAETTKELAENQKLVAEQNTNATKELAQKQQESQTERLQMQIAALETEREKASAERAEIRDIEEKRSLEQVAFAKEQADQNLKLAKLAMFNQTVQNGLTPNSTNSGSGLSTNPITAGRGDSSNSGAGFTGQLANNGGSGGSNPLALGVANSGSNTSRPRLNGGTALNSNRAGVGAKRGMASLKPANSVQGKGRLSLNSNNKPNPAPKSGASASLLSSVRKDFSKSLNSRQGRGVSGMLKPVVPSRFAAKKFRGVNQAVLMRNGSNRALASAMKRRRGMIGGSTRGLMQRIKGEAGVSSGLRDFARAVDRNRNTRGRHTRGTRRGIGSGRVNNGHGVKSYNLGSSRGRGSVSGFRKLGR